MMGSRVTALAYTPNFSWQSTYTSQSSACGSGHVGTRASLIFHRFAVRPLATTTSDVRTEKIHLTADSRMHGLSFVDTTNVAPSPVAPTRLKDLHRATVIVDNAEGSKITIVLFHTPAGLCGWVSLRLFLSGHQVPSFFQSTS